MEQAPSGEQFWRILPEVLEEAGLQEGALFGALSCTFNLKERSVALLAWAATYGLDATQEDRRPYEAQLEAVCW